MKFAFIKENREVFEVELMCEVLEVSRSGFYQWLTRKPSQRDKRQQELIGKIQTIHHNSRGVYGSPRVFKQLKADGEEVCENTVARLMKKCGIKSKVQRVFRVRTTDARHEHRVADNVLDRRFDQPLPDQAWAADITYVPTDEGWLYLAAVIDLCSRKIVGWATADHLRTDLCEAALAMALSHRRPEPGLLHHSDRGVQYACDQYQILLEKNQMACSMSRKGNCWDNAVMESFFKTLKAELVHHEVYATRAAAHQSLFEYIEVFYNRQRLHSSLGYVSPAQFEARIN